MRRRISAACVLLVLHASGLSEAWGQSNATAIDASTPPAITSLPHTSYWKFGLRIKATGRTTGVVATVPVPVAWPEQQVEVTFEDKSEGVTSARLKGLAGNARQLVIRASRLQAGQTIEATVTMKILKLESSAPASANELQFASPVPSRVREYLQPSPFIESRDERIVRLAEQLPINPDDPAWEQVKTIYDWVRDNIEYTFDEQIRSCLYALEHGRGDCEEMSSLFVALCRARGIPARAVWIPLHTYPEFYLVDAEGNGLWLPCQAAGAYAFGEMPEAKPILQKGDKFRVRGHAEPLRYIQPTLTARDASSPPTIEWIMTEVDPPKSPE